DAFHASRNFHDPGDVGTPAPGVNTDPLANQNGIVFFPGSTPLYKTQILVGGFGISGDGVDQDDVVTSGGQQGFAPPQNLRADMVFYRGDWVGGGLPVFGEGRTLEEGTFGWDYFGILFNKRVALNFSHGRLDQGGFGAYKTDGPRHQRR